MKLTKKELSDLCKTAEQAALKAGALIQSALGKKQKKRIKSTGSSIASQLVTETDLASQECILSLLPSSIRDYNIGLLTEESQDNGSRFSNDFFWCIDPLDGTLPFTEKREGYAVAIALLQRCGTPLIGIAYDPYKSELYSAIRGEGVRRNGLPLSLPKSNTVVFVSDSSIRNSKHYPQVLDEWNERAKKANLRFKESPHSFGAVKSVLTLIEAGGGTFSKAPKKTDGCGSIWDYAATTCIARELGFKVTAYNGSTLDLNSSETTFMNRQGISYWKL